MKSEWFNPHKSFLTLKIVWVTVFLLVAMSFLSAALISLNSELKVDLSYSGFNHFISAFRFPLAIAALIIPVIALLAANHRSEQTKEQIRVTNSQNVFSNYYKHMEEFTKYAASRVDTEVDLRFVHGKVYPNSSQGDYAISAELVILLSKLENVTQDVLKYYPSDINEKLNDDLKKKYYVVIHDIYAFIYRNKSDYRKHVTYSKPTEHGDTYLFQSLSMIRHVLKAIEIAEEICKFSVDYVSPFGKVHIKKQKLNSIYVLERTQQTSSLAYAPNKEEQTFEEANQRFVEILNNSLQSKT